MKNLMLRLWKEEDGQDLVEYALLVALVALGATAAMKILATSIGNAFNSVESNLALNVS